MKLQKLAFFCLAGFVSTLVADVPEVGTPISSVPKTITKPGTYTLKKNLILSATNGVGITIQAENVTIDLNGHSISSSAPADASINSSKGIFMSTGKSVTVRNGTLRGFREGVNLTSNDGKILVQNVQCENSVTVGIQVTGDTVCVRDCSVRNTGLGLFISTMNIWGITASATWFFATFSG